MHSSKLMITLSKFGLRVLQSLQLDTVCDKAIVDDECENFCDSQTLLVLVFLSIMLSDILNKYLKG